MKKAYNRAVSEAETLRKCCGEYPVIETATKAWPAITGDRSPRVYAVIKCRKCGRYRERSGDTVEQAFQIARQDWQKRRTNR